MRKKKITVCLTLLHIRQQNLPLAVHCEEPVLMYCLHFQGLFHPARKVRDVYWKIYNSIYIGSQDALIAHYPQVYNDEKNVYVRYELEYVL